MARGLQINKKYSKNGIYYYKVDDYSHVPEGNFYIGIDSVRKIVHYYKSIDLENTIGSMDF